MTDPERSETDRVVEVLLPGESRMFPPRAPRKRYQVIKGVIGFQNWLVHSEGVSLGALVDLPVGEFFKVGGSIYEAHIHNIGEEAAEYRELRELPKNFGSDK